MAKHVQAVKLDSRLTPHCLRHGFATHLLVNGCDLVSVSRLLGHEDLATTSLYTSVSPTELHKTFLSAHPRAHRQENNHG
jgi:site-specific recombinase XerD